MTTNKNKLSKYLSVTEASALLGISREAVLKRIKTGNLKAERIGHIFAIPKNEPSLDKSPLSINKKKQLEKDVQKTLKEYREAKGKLSKFNQIKQNILRRKIIEVIKKSPDRDYIKSISLFGSYLHGDETENSDIDLLFEMRKTMSLFEIIDVKHSLEKKLGRKVDFVEKGSVISQLKNKIIPEAKIIYEYK